jgi:GTPase SAR1 family protein
MYYRNAAAAIVCFDMTDEDSFAMMKDWVDELKNNVEDGNLVLAIAANKSDLADKRVVSKEQAEAYAAEIGAIIFETSAKDNIGVSEIFGSVSETVIKTRGADLAANSGAQSTAMRVTAATGGGGRGLSPAARAAGFGDPSARRQNAAGGCGCG